MIGRKKIFLNPCFIYSSIISLCLGIEYFDIKKSSVVDIDDFPFDMPEEIKKKIVDDIQYRPQMYHKQFDSETEIGDIAFDLGDESEGTVKFYNLAGKIIHVLHNGLVLIADELNNSLHPLLTQYLIRLFQNPKTNPNHAQLIFATHDTTLLNSDIFQFVDRTAENFPIAYKGKLKTLSSQQLVPALIAFV